MARDVYPSMSDRRTPRSGRNYSGKCDVRLDTQELNMLDSLSNERGVTRSDIMRRALRDFYKFNKEDSDVTKEG